MLTEAQRALLARIEAGWDLVANGSIGGQTIYWWRDERQHVDPASAMTVRALIRRGYLRWGYTRPGRLPVAVVTPAGHRAEKPPRVAGQGSRRDLRSGSEDGQVDPDRKAPQGLLRDPTIR